MQTIIYDNHLSGKKSPEQVGAQLLTAIMNHGNEEIKLIVDDGDGDVYTFRIECFSEKSPHIHQIKEN